ncbi:MAG: Hsp20/alpha crystallin family protein [Pirellulaceae bacterium]|nr:Hsp20/alpha crystallin family protein [Pirellulaceae bacterium]
MFENLIPWKRKKQNDLVMIDPTNEWAQFRANFDRMLEHVWQGDWDEVWNNGWGCDVKDAETELVVRAEAPGFEPDEIDIRLSGNRLILEAEHKSDRGDGNGQFSSYGRFYRSMSVPTGIEADKIAASYKNGILEIHLPKGEAARCKRIAVTAS